MMDFPSTSAHKDKRLFEVVVTTSGAVGVSPDTSKERPPKKKKQLSSVLSPSRYYQVA